MNVTFTITEVELAELLKVLRVGAEDFANLREVRDRHSWRLAYAEAILKARTLLHLSDSYNDKVL